MFVINKVAIIFLLILVSFVSRAQKVCICDYNISDTVFFYYIMTQEQNEWEEIKKTYSKVIQDTMNLDSLVLSYYENGKLYRRVPYMGGTCCGYYEEYYSNGQLHYRVHMNNGKISDGKYYYYGIDGSITEEGNCKNGVRVGIWYVYVFRQLFKKYTYKSDGRIKSVHMWNVEKSRWERIGISGTKITITDESGNYKVYEYYD